MHGYIISFCRMMCNRRRHFLLLSLLLAGCGQRGPLFLPPPNPPAADHAEVAAP